MERGGYTTSPKWRRGSDIMQNIAVTCGVACECTDTPPPTPPAQPSLKQNARAVVLTPLPSQPASGARAPLAGATRLWSVAGDVRPQLPGAASSASQQRPRCV